MVFEWWRRKDKNMKKENEIEEQQLQDENLQQAEQTNEQAEQTEQAEAAEPTAEEQMAALNAKIAELEDKNLRMLAEFENYRRRTNKEKLDLIQTAGERIFKDMLPLVDDFERAAEHGDLSEGGQLIYKKFVTFLQAQHVTAIATTVTAEDGSEVAADFNTDEHEAITTFAAGEDKKGKIIDCTQKGYKLGEKVIRFAKVVVGE